MLKRTTFAAVILLWMFIGTIAGAVESGANAKPPTADEIVANFRKAAGAVKSFSCAFKRYDLGDEFVVARHKDAMKAYEPLLSKLEMLTRKKMMPELKQNYEIVGTCDFIKPFSMQVVMKKDDFLPPLLNGSIVYYRPDVNEDEVFLKEPILGIVFRRPSHSDSAPLMITNWAYDLLELDCAIANGGKATYAGTEKLNGKNMRMIDVPLKLGKSPWNVDCAENTHGIPKAAQREVDRDMMMNEQRLKKYGEKGAFIRYWIDPDLNLSVKKSIRFGSVMAVEQTMENIKLNSVDVKKLIRPSK